MRKILFPLFLLLFALCTTTTVKAQVDVTLNPIGLLFGDISLGADFVLTEKFSVEGAVGFGANKIDDVKGTNIGLNAVGKYYFNPARGGDRFYADVFLRYIGRNWNYDDNSILADYRTNRIGIGFGLGYKIVSSGNFVFDIGLGVGRAIVDKNVYKDNQNSTQVGIDWPDIMFQGKLGIGYRFGGSRD